MPVWLIELFARYSYGAVFAGVMLENAGLPVPGETVLLAAAALARFGHLSLTFVILAAIGGAILGDNVGFLVGRRGGRAFVVRFGGRLGLTQRRLAQFDRFFDRHGPKTVFIARFVTGLRVFGAILAGTSELGWRTFFFYNATGAIVWSTAIGLAGYLLGESWETLEQWIGRSAVVALAVVAAVVLFVVLRARREQT